MKITLQIVLAAFVLVVLEITPSIAATMNDYCVVPPFIQEIAKPNLLMIIDNSASMYDLAYDDKGYRRCSSTTSQSCSVDTDCPSGETCAQVRNPSYCYDKTFSSSLSYVGYFDPAKNYKYNFGTNRFQVEEGSIPANCSMAAVDDVVYCKLISNTLHLNIDKSDPTRTKHFYASGKFLNWLNSSKFDVEKQVLTGGKYVTKVCSNNADKACLVDSECGTGNTCNATSAFLQPETRGCVGMGYVKDTNTSNFVNFATGTADPNTDLNLTFLVKGPSNPYNVVAPSTGGQTYLNIFTKSGTSYDNEACDLAIEAIATANGAGQVFSAVDNCLASGGTVLGYCQQSPASSCIASYGPTAPNCDIPIVAAHCSGDATRTCTVATQATDCFISGAQTCTTGNVGVVCTANSNCDVKACSLNAGRSCSVDADCVKSNQGYCSLKTTKKCSDDGDCGTGFGTCLDKPYDDGTCGVTVVGTCTASGDLNVGPCIPETGGYIGPCVLAQQSAAVKTKTSFIHSMQACWALRKIPKDIGHDEYMSIRNDCSDVYGAYKTCSNDGYQTCSTDVDCGSGNTCLSGPYAIQPGNPALICSINYAGQLYEQNASGAWVLRSALPAATPASCLSTDTVEECAIKIHTLFCNTMDEVPVTDPTNPPSAVVATENLPAILSGLGVEAQLGAPILTLPVRIETSVPPSNLVQEYAQKIRMGLMAFNTYGSSTEVTSGLLTATKVCSNDPTKVCTQDIDCGKDSTGTYYDCNNAGDSDAAKILSLIGKGHCSSTTTTECTKKVHCPGTETCVNDGVGSHTTGGLVYSIDSLRAATWTPFAEAYYNAIGYFGVSPSDSTGKTSRTDLRINSGDFPDSMNPSEYVCQSNNILLVTDGSSTADQNSAKTDLVDAYKAVSGNVTGTCTKYAGSQDLDDLSWLARHRNINTFDKTTASTTEPLKKNEYITSYIVFNGADNGEAADCNNTTVLTKAANNGGTDVLKADIPDQYEDTLRRAFEQVAGGTASGTAASILSNSEGSGANILQAVFYPSKDFETESGQTIPTSATWIGEMQNLWYYVDPYIGNSSVREDTINDPVNVKALHVVNDYVTEYQFKGGETIAVLKKDTNGDGSGDTVVTEAMDARIKNQGYCTNTSNLSISTYAKCVNDDGCTTGETCNVQGIVNADDVNSLWRAGKLLWSRDLDTVAGKRKLYTYLYGSSFADCGASTFSVNGMYDLAAIDWSSISATNKCILKAYLNIPNPATAADSEAINIIKFVQGYDHEDYDSSTGKITGTIDGKKPRNRSVQIDGSKNVWKLGDIIASTPRIQSFNKLNNYHQDSPMGYGDMTYADDSTGKGYANSTAYKARGMAYAGANDGMLHAFKLGSLSIIGSGQTKATLNNPDVSTPLGHEQWAFIPKNVLPYLKYLSDPQYSHLYLVDGPTRLLDASIGYNDNTYIPVASRTIYSNAGCDAGGSGVHTAYWACKEDPATDNNKSWRTILIGSMGIGGASAEKDAVCTNCVKNPVTGTGKSSYYALDITDPANPTFMWDFSHAEMGFATTGAAATRINHKFDAGGITYKDTNGRWFAVIGNGPTGPIDTTYHQFKGKSDNPLRVFVLDLKTGELLRKFDTSINYAFSGSMSSAPIDTDRSRKLDSGNYSDDALYFGYSNCTSNCDTDTPAWNGGIMRLLTDENSILTDNWSLTTLISNIGPISTAIGKLQDRKNKNLWLYTGTGRYFFKGDDSTNPGKILAVKEPCYNGVNDANDIHTLSAIDSNGCDTEMVFDEDDFANQTSAINDMVSNLGVSKKGWFVELADQDNVNNFGAERIITEPVAMPNGAVFFTSFMPSTDICNYGGKSYMWGMRYDTGGTASTNQLKGKALVQVSTGAFEEVDLSIALTAELGRKMADPMIGKPPTDPPPIVSASGNKPLKRILHIQEK